MYLNQLQFELSAYLLPQLPPSDLPEVLFSGRSNVGKSALINALACRKGLARVSSAPGKTASVNFYSDGRFRLVDLPGYGYAKVSRSEKAGWATLMEGFFAQKRRITLFLQLIDARRPATEDDRAMLALAGSRGYPCLAVMTKSDKLSKTELEARRAAAPGELASFPGLRTTFVSARCGDGIEALAASIISAAILDADAPGSVPGEGGR